MSWLRFCLNFTDMLEQLGVCRLDEGQSRFEMTMAVPKKILTIWGANGGEAFGLLSEMLVQRGFKGPLTWKHGYLVPYLIDPCNDIRVILSFSRGGGVGEARFF
ncbi:hypothetical protein LPN04_10820 [Rugamonas sp. A1-17]|nr:hypothetical protein [Rugamonas sp. A1-17]